MPMVNVVAVPPAAGAVQTVARVSETVRFQVPDVALDPSPPAVAVKVTG